MTNILTLEQIDNLPPTECQCDKCKGMCAPYGRPCWGTPAEMRVLLNNGFAKKLMCDYYDGDLMGEYIEHTEIITPALVGHEGKYAPFWPMGTCSLLTEKGLCSVHSMKPVEGRVCDHRHDESVEYIHQSLVHIWNTDEGKAVVDLWMELK